MGLACEFARLYLPTSVRTLTGGQGWVAVVVVVVVGGGVGVVVVGV